MEIKQRINSGDGRSEVVVFTAERGTFISSKTKIDFQRETVNKCLAFILSNDSVKIEHRKNGAPFLSSDTTFNISISHSEEWFAIQFSKEREVGVDIQVVKNNLYKSRTYFVNADEELSIELNDLNLNVIWAAKEAVYKLKQGEIENYKESMTVKSIDSDKLIVHIEKEEISCSWSISDDVILVYID